MAVPPEPSDAPPITGTSSLTRRQVLEQTVEAEASCSGCHRLIGSAGVSLERIDPLTGLARATDNGLPIDTSGTFKSTQRTFAFAGIEDFAPQIVDSCQVARCFVKRYTDDAASAVGVPPFSDEERAYLTFVFASSGLSLERLLVALVQLPTFLE